MIPKKIHYCWFGKKEKPKYIRKCIDSWKILGYEIYEWNEDNYDLNKHPYVKCNYLEKKWAFVSDYVRLDVLYKYGGIYLDTDVKFIKKLPDDYLNVDFLLGFQFECILGTHIIGAKKESRVLKLILDEYNVISKNQIFTNNMLFNEFFLEKVPSFKLNGKTQTIIFDNEKIIVYAKHYFSCPIFFKEGYAFHLLDNSWRNKKYIKLKKVLKSIIGNSVYYNLIAWRAIRKSYSNKYKEIYDRIKRNDKI